jgi:hypothetical protein
MILAGAIVVDSDLLTFLLEIFDWVVTTTIILPSLN